MVYHKQSFNAKNDREQDGYKIEWAFSRLVPCSFTNLSDCTVRTHPYASLSRIPDRISCGGLILVIVRKLEEGLVLGPAPGRSFPEFSGPARLLMLTVVRGGGREVIAIVGGGRSGRGRPCSQTSEHLRKSPRVAIPVRIYSSQCQPRSHACPPDACARK